jgi:hypothetical protein
VVTTLDKQVKLSLASDVERWIKSFTFKWSITESALYQEIQKRKTSIFQSKVYKGMYYRVDAIAEIEEVLGVNLNTDLPQSELYDIIQKSLFSYHISSATSDIEVARYFARSADGTNIEFVAELTGEFFDVINFVEELELPINENILANLKEEKEIIVLNPVYKIIELTDRRISQ